jgi:hypothetical protein
MPKRYPRDVRERPTLRDRSRFSPLLGDRRSTQDLLMAASLHVAFRTRPHGSAGRDDPARAVERLEPGALHEQSRSHISVWEKPSAANL